MRGPRLNTLVVVTMANFEMGQKGRGKSRAKGELEDKSHDGVAAEETLGFYFGIFKIDRRQHVPHQGRD